MDFETSKQIVRKVASDVEVDGLTGNKWDFIADFIDDQPDETKIALKQHFDAFLIRMKRVEASDIDLGGPGCNYRVWYRIHGNKRPDEQLGEYSIAETDLLILNILTEEERKRLLQQNNVDFSYRVFDRQQNVWTRFRATIYFDLTHLAVNMRRINDHIIPFPQLGFNEQVAKVLSLKYQKSGLVLVTGITGSGKSTTLDSIIDANNKTMESHIVIISDPIEYVHKPIRSIVKHREIGRDVNSFKEGTIQALRQDPDIIMIGEMRDADTIMTVLEVVDSGHKVFSTLHTSSAIESIDRILGEIPTNEQQRIRSRLADVLSCVISQKLIPGQDGKRILAKEILLSNSSVKTAIRNDNVGEIYQIIHQSNDQGMITMEQDLARLYASNQIPYFEGYINANNKKRFEELAKYS